MDVSAMFPKQVLQIFCSVNFRPFSVSKERSEFVNKFRVGKHPSILQIIHAPGPPPPAFRPFRDTSMRAAPMDVSAMFPKHILQIFCSVNFRPFSVSKERSEFDNKFCVVKHPSILPIIHAPGRKPLYAIKRARHVFVFTRKSRTFEHSNQTTLTHA